MNRRHKYGAAPTAVDGIRFASKKEAKRYQELQLLMKAGKIEGLLLQPRYPIEFDGYRICVYVADFTYYENGRRVVEDCKGFKTPEYKLKKKLFEARYRIKILET